MMNRRTLLGLLAAMVLAVSAHAQPYTGAAQQAPATPPLRNQLNTFALVGTSREQQQAYFGNSAWNYFNWGNYISGGKYQLVYNGGQSGYSERRFMDAGLNGALGSGAKFVILGGVINDDLNGLTYTGDQIWDSSLPGAPPGTGYLQALRRIIANGQTPVLQCEYLQEGANDPVKIAMAMRYNQLAREFAATGQAIYLDFCSPMWNPLTTQANNIRLVPNTTNDGTHPNLLGGYLLGQVFDATMTRYVPPLPVLSNAVVDNLLSNGLFLTQTGGSVTGAGTLSSGAVPAGWTLNIPAGYSVALSYVTEPNGFGSRLRMAVTNTSGGNGNGPSLQAYGPTVAVPGQQFVGGFQGSVVAGSSNFNAASASAQVYFNGGSKNSTDFQNATNGTGNGLAVAYTYSTLTAPTDRVPATTSISPPILNIGTTFSANGSGTIDIGRAFLRVQ